MLGFFIDHKKKKERILPLADKGQVLLEFTFCMIIVFLMIYGVTKAFIWTGRDFAERANAHDALLESTISTDYGQIEDGPLRQIDPYYYTPVGMNAIFGEN